MQGIEIRPLRTLEELAAVEDIQRAVWDAPSTVVYQHMLISFVRNGGSVLGAVREGQVVGFVLSFLGAEDPESDRPAMANLKLVSQRMAVLPEYRNTGLGYELKMAQRQHAIDKGIRLITWTFDPLMSRNAHLNIRKLGALVFQYYRDYFGTHESPLVTLHSSDRVLVEWWVTHNRVEQRISGKRGGLTIEQYVLGNARLLNPALPGADGLLRPASSFAAPENAIVLVEIPTNYDQMVERDPGLAMAWRQHSRESLESTLQAGYAITDFVHGTYEGRERSLYVLSFADYIDVARRKFVNN